MCFIFSFLNQFVYENLNIQYITYEILKLKYKLLITMINSTTRLQNGTFCLCEHGLILT